MSRKAVRAECVDGPPLHEHIATRDTHGPATVLKVKARVQDLLMWIHVTAPHRSRARTRAGSDSR
ncbi:hypothetical protein AB0D49_29325 [Streptomyces sp. NPDC048290]|uniref:hypothetical protein n=1 Tax=Streptomyces sp. NPDC048290 TaxID=3155811 RepID=UPI003437B087